MCRLCEPFDEDFERPDPWERADEWREQQILEALDEA